LYFTCFSAKLEGILATPRVLDSWPTMKCCRATPQGFPLIYKRRRLDSLNPYSISFSEQIPAGRRADRKREAVVFRRRYEFDNGSLPAKIGFSRRAESPPSTRRVRKSYPEIPLLLAPAVFLAHDGIQYLNVATPYDPMCPISGPLRMITSCMRNYKHPLDALERLDPEWERAVRDLHRTGWRQ
jgi:hypothetical protein